MCWVPGEASYLLRCVIRVCASQIRTPGSGRSRKSREIKPVKWEVSPRPVFFLLHAAEAGPASASADKWAGPRVTPAKHRPTGRDCSLQLLFVCLGKSSVFLESLSFYSLACPWWVK